MALSLFVDALPYTEIISAYSNWMPRMQVAELQPNIGYSSSLHWQLYCDKYPDDRGRFVDWGYTPEKNKMVCLLATVLRPLDNFDWPAFIARKCLDRVIFRSNVMANIPFKFRPDFSNTSKYLFFDKESYGHEKNFEGYDVVAQDEGHYSFDETIDHLMQAIEKGNKNIFGAFGAIDSMGHKCSRGAIYDERIRPYMDSLKNVITAYQKLHPDEEILIASDHGMSTINAKVDLEMEKHFGKQSKNTYIAYMDSCIMCIWVKDNNLKKKIKEYLESKSEGHLISEEERIKYRATDRKFGDLIFNLREGNCFKTSWFGKGVHKSPDGEGMHGFWPERTAKDQMASIILINGKRRIKDFYVYPEAYELVSEIMQEHEG